MMKFTNLSTYDQCVFEYQRRWFELTNVEKAELEAKIWTDAPKGLRKGKTREVFLSDLLGDTQYEYAQRGYLWHAEGVDPLWRRLENDMQLATAVTLWRRAKRRAFEDGTTLPSALEKELRVYDKLPVASVHKGGKVIRRKTARTITKKKPIGARKKTARGFWEGINKAIRDYAGQWLVTVPEGQAGALAKELQTDLKIVFTDWQRKVANAKLGAKKQKQLQVDVTRRGLRHAFEVLRIDMPRRSKPIDIKALKKRKRELVKQYHPDHNNGDESFLEQYNDVLEAYNTITDYAEKTGGIL